MERLGSKHAKSFVYRLSLYTVNQMFLPCSYTCDSAHQQEAMMMIRRRKKKKKTTLLLLACLNKESDVDCEKTCDWLSL